jgi:hypothetical protein
VQFDPCERDFGIIVMIHSHDSKQEPYMIGCRADGCWAAGRGRARPSSEGLGLFHAAGTAPAGRTAACAKEREISSRPLAVQRGPRQCACKTFSSRIRRVRSERRSAHAAACAGRRVPAAPVTSLFDPAAPPALGRAALAIAAADLRHARRAMDAAGSSRSCLPLRGLLSRPTLPLPDAPPPPPPPPPSLVPPARPSKGASTMRQRSCGGGA